FGRGKVVGPTGLGNRCFALDDIQYQCTLALGCPAFDFVFHLYAHSDFLNYHLSRFLLGHYTNAEVEATSSVFNCSKWAAPIYAMIDYSKLSETKLQSL